MIDAGQSRQKAGQINGLSCRQAAVQFRPISGFIGQERDVHLRLQPFRLL
jgi:hypothetical protein